MSTMVAAAGHTRKPQPSTPPSQVPVPSTAASGSRPELTAALLDWYDRHRRSLPWRSEPSAPSDPYAVWLSEIMLQQTTVAAVKPYFAEFLRRWPTVSALAQAPLDEVLRAWSGLGYYARARNLHACAKAVMSEHAGAFPSTEAGLRSLPGIGAYTAAAIAAIAFGRRAVVVDGNVERVMARLGAVGTPLPRAKPMLWHAMDAITPSHRAGDLAQAVMDLGATICTPKSPACIICPVATACAANQAGSPLSYPVKQPKPAVPERGGAVFVVTRDDGAFLLRTRPSAGLFGGMTEFPGTMWSKDFILSEMTEFPPGITGPFTPFGTVQHGLTHFSLTLHVMKALASRELTPGSRWVARDAVHAEALPTLMRKVLEIALRMP